MILRQIAAASASRPRRKLVIGVLSALGYEERRAACRRTWVGAARASGDVEIVFLVGAPAVPRPLRFGDVLVLPCADDYPSLPQKTRGFLAWALARYDCERLFKCDDDTYVHVERLLAFDARGAEYVGADVGGYASGGAGYLLSARAAAAIVGELAARPRGPEDLIAGELLRRNKIQLAASARFRPFGGAGEHPTPGNAIITGHYLTPRALDEVHAPFAATAPTCGDLPQPLFRLIDWRTGYGALGLDGALGHDVEGEPLVRPPAPFDWRGYQLIAGHVDCRVELELRRPAALFGFLDGKSWHAPDSPVTFAIAGDPLGCAIGPGERTRELRLAAGRHVLTTTTPGDITRRYPVWALRPLPSACEPRIAIPTSNGYERALGVTLALLDRYWPAHPPVDVIHHEAAPRDRRVRGFYAGPQSAVSWCEALERYLEHANHDELVLLLLDDYALCRSVKPSRIAEARDLMLADPSLAAFYLTWMMLPSSEPYAGRDDVIVWPRWDYSVHTQAGLWRRRSLQRALRRVGRASIERFELDGSDHFNQHESAWERHVSFRVPEPPSPSLFLDEVDKRDWPIAYHNLFRRGRLDARHSGFLAGERLA